MIALLASTGDQRIDGPLRDLIDAYELALPMSPIRRRVIYFPLCKQNVLNP